MSYVGEMKDLIELYLAELERDGLDNVLGVGLPVVSGILTDFAQWLEDDVQDTETTLEGNDLEWMRHQEWMESGEDLNLTGFGDIVDSPVENWDMPSQDEQNKSFDVADWAAKRRQYLQRLRADSAWGYLNALNKGEDSDSANS